jgi:competence ComEA-like helix-hairpin-helix protein
MMYYFFLIFVSMSLLTGALNATELQSFKGCKLVDAAWADGDSFPVRFPDGSEHTIRLYGADCLEANVNDTTDARRLRAQRRYFGISDYGDSPRSSIELAKSVGVEAKTQVRQILEQPFTVHTAFADGGGSGHYKRFYAFVATATGEDLATLLVERGLARAFGLYRSTAQNLQRDEYRERLKDAELVAARNGLGAWAHTNWEELPEERRAERREEAEDAIAMGRAPPSEPLSINRASAEALARIPGIGNVLAQRIIEARPFATVDELKRVSGIGPATLEEIREFVIP